MATIKNIFTALLTFMTGVLFAYFTYPFFESLFGSVSTLASVDGWENFGYITGLAWAGWFGIIFLWILVAPAYKIFVAEQE